MKKYHILFKPENQNTATGENFTNEDEQKALLQFKEKYPTAEFISMYVVDEFGRLSY